MLENENVEPKEVIDKKKGLTSEIICTVLSFCTGQMISLILIVIALILGQTNSKLDPQTEKTRQTLRKVAWVMFAIGIVVTILVIILCLTLSVGLFGTAINALA